MNGGTKFLFRQKIPLTEFICTWNTVIALIRIWIHVELFIIS